MPVHAARVNGRPAYQWGTRGKKYPHTPGNEAERKRAKQQAYIQGYAAEQNGAEKMSKVWKSWSRPGLGDIYPDKVWADLSGKERAHVRSLFAYAPAGAKTFEDLKLPYRDPSGKVNPAGVRNALSRLPQTQGIPAAERARIKAKLERILAGITKDNPGMGDVHIPGSMGQSIAEFRRRRGGRNLTAPNDAAPKEISVAFSKADGPYLYIRGRRIRTLTGQLPPAFAADSPEQLTPEVLPAEIVVATGFVKADNAAVEKDDGLRLALGESQAERDHLTGAVASALSAMAGAPVRFAKRAADPVELYDLVLKRSLPPGADDDEEQEEEAEEDDREDLDFEEGPAVFRILKADAPQQKMTGVVLEPHVVDTQDDFEAPEEIEKAAHLFMQKYRAGQAHLGLQHQRMLKDEEAHLCESWIAPENLKVGSEPVRKGSWLQTWHVKDPALWASIEKGDITGFSFGGSGLRHKANHPIAPLA
ncbi:MAG: XkdF-like putative serine protease domain-containing protein [Elusimicrobia bacterium]|nr:XkdF-like putative serine protease domain-containing protein [Elusimicrobiota bacterium]